MMALAAQHNIATVLVPGGATLPAKDGEDNGKVQTIGARFANGELSLQDARRAGCKACASSGRRLSIFGHCRDIVRWWPKDWDWQSHIQPWPLPVSLCGGRSPELPRELR